MKTKVQGVCLLFFMFLSLFVGVESIPILHLFHFNGHEKLVFWFTRIPRTASLVIAGATCSVCGLIMQQLTQNRYVSPTTVGTMDSARFGMLMAMLFFPSASILTRTLVAFIFAFLGTYLFLYIIKNIPVKNKIMIPLIGVMYGNIIGSLVTFFAYQFQLIQNMTSWLQGNFATVTKGDYELIYISVPILGLCYFFAYHFTILGLGSDTATNIGINYERAQLLSLLLIAVASSVTLVTIGSLPFLGVIIPNIISYFYGDNLRNTLWITAISGSLFLIICDIVSRVIYPPYEIPVSLVVGIIGSVVFIFLLVKG